MHSNLGFLGPYPDFVTGDKLELCDPVYCKNHNLGPVKCVLASHILMAKLRITPHLLSDLLLYNSCDIISCPRAGFPRDRFRVFVFVLMKRSNAQIFLCIGCFLHMR